MTKISDSDHILRVAGETELPPDPASETASWRKRIEPWLSAVFQAEHLSLLLGNGFTTSIAEYSGATAVPMGLAEIRCANADKMRAHAQAVATATGRGAPNIEDQLSSALSLLSGLEVLQHPDAAPLKIAIDKILNDFIRGVLATEKGIRSGLNKSSTPDKPLTGEVLVSFLMSFASRAASRERLHIFTTRVTTQ